MVIWGQSRVCQCLINTIHIVKYGRGNIKLWEYFPQELGNFLELKGELMENKYLRNITREPQLQSAVKLRLGTGITHQQDNNPRQKAKATLEWLKNCTVSQPSRSIEVSTKKNVEKTLQINVKSWYSLTSKDLRLLLQQRGSLPRINV